jgi:hypothetical protein
MGICPDCGSTGQANRDCPNKSSDSLWDGGALCIGISEGTLNDIIRYMALSICNISTSLSGIGVTAANVAITGQIGGCITSSSTLASWVTNVETYLCSLGTTVTGLDFTEPIYFNGVPTVVDTKPSLTVTDTITIAANTLNEDYEYLKVEVWGSVSVVQTGASAMRIAFLGKNWDFIFSSIPPPYVKSPWYEQMKIELNIVRSGTTQFDWDCHAFTKRWRGVEMVETNVGATVTPVSFTSSANLVVSAYNDSDEISVKKVRITKFNIH